MGREVMIRYRGNEPKVVCESCGGPMKPGERGSITVALEYVTTINNYGSRGIVKDYIRNHARCRMVCPKCADTILAMLHLERERDFG